MFQKIINKMAKKKKTNDDAVLEKDIIVEEIKETIESTENGEETIENEDSEPIVELTKEEQMAKEIEDLQYQVSDLKDKNLRMRAEFDNFRKRTVKEKLDMMKNAAQDTLSALLPVLDDFDRAKKNAEDESSKEPFSEGVNLVYAKLYTILQNKGLKPMESTSEEFDPELHEAVTEFPAPSEDMKGKVFDTIERGYFLNDKIIRHAKVVVAK